MNTTAEHSYPFREPSVDKIAEGFSAEFPKIIQNDQFLNVHMWGLRLFAQQVLNATDAKSLQTEGEVNESHPVVGPPETKIGTAMQFDEEGKFQSIGPVVSEEQTAHQRVSTHRSFTIGGEGETSNEPWPIPLHDALSYIADPDIPSIVKDTFDLPHSDRGLPGFRTFLITQLCQTDDRLAEWIKTKHGNKELRAILLDAAIADKSVIERFRLRKTALDIKDDVPITRCVTDANYAHVEGLFTKLIGDLTFTDKPSPDAPAPTS